MQTIKPETPCTMPEMALKMVCALLQDAVLEGLLSVKEGQRDMERAIMRTTSEGLSFLTKTLPTYAKALEKGLELSCYPGIHGFGYKPRTVLPAFLCGLLGRVFETNGDLKSTPCVLSIKYIRQISYLLYKLEMEFHENQVQKLVESFKEKDRLLTHCEEIQSDDWAVVHTFQEIIGDVFGQFDQRPCVPRPGPGATACKTPRSGRFSPNHVFMDLDNRFPYGDYMYLNRRHFGSHGHAYLPALKQGWSELIPVPKDSRGPRFICEQVNEYMLIQQGIWGLMKEWLEGHPTTRGHVNFSSQSHNQMLALTSSWHGKYGTLDMKDASDNISRVLVEVGFDSIPDLRDDLLALSPTDIRYPDKSCGTLRKFAPMGSALCFPIMSVVHFALALAAISVHTGKPWRSHKRDVYVYGDDIIVKTEYVDYLFENFPRFGLIFNEHKSFYRGKFRESCGVDAYNGFNVTPIRLRRLFCDASAKSLVSFTDNYNNLKKGGYNCLALVIRKEVVRIFPDLPYVSEYSGVPGFHCRPDEVFISNDLKWNTDLQTWCKRVRVVTTPNTASIDGYAGVYRSLTYSFERTFSLRDTSIIKWKNVPYVTLAATCFQDGEANDVEQFWSHLGKE